MIRNDITQQPLVQVASWTLGEFGDLFISGQYQPPDDGENIQVNFNSKHSFSHTSFRSPRMKSLIS